MVVIYLVDISGKYSFLLKWCTYMKENVQYYFSVSLLFHTKTSPRYFTRRQLCDIWHKSSVWHKSRYVIFLMKMWVRFCMKTGVSYFSWRQMFHISQENKPVVLHKDKYVWYFARKQVWDVSHGHRCVMSVISYEDKCVIFHMKVTVKFHLSLLFIAFT